MTGARDAAAPHGCGADGKAAGPAPIIPQAADTEVAATVPALHELSARGRTVALAYFEAGLVEGIAEGRRQVEDELAAEWAALRAEVLPRLRASEPYATLAERRGQPERAERQRSALRARGVWPVAS